MGRGWVGLRSRGLGAWPAAAARLHAIGWLAGRPPPLQPPWVPLLQRWSRSSCCSALSSLNACTGFRRPSLQKREEEKRREEREGARLSRIRRRIEASEAAQRQAEAAQESEEEEI